MRYLLRDQVCTIVGGENKIYSYFFRDEAVSFACTDHVVDFKSRYDLKTLDFLEKVEGEIKTMLTHLKNMKTLLDLKVDLDTKGEIRCWITDFYKNLCHILVDYNKSQDTSNLKLFLEKAEQIAQTYDVFENHPHVINYLKLMVFKEETLKLKLVQSYNPKTSIKSMKKIFGSNLSQVGSLHKSKIDSYERTISTLKSELEECQIKIHDQAKEIESKNAYISKQEKVVMKFAEPEKKRADIPDKNQKQQRTFEEIMRNKFLNDPMMKMHRKILSKRMESSSKKKEMTETEIIRLVEEGEYQYDKNDIVMLVDSPTPVSEQEQKLIFSVFAYATDRNMSHKETGRYLYSQLMDKHKATWRGHVEKVRFGVQGYWAGRNLEFKYRGRECFVVKYNG